MLTDTRLTSIKPPANGQEEHPDHKVTGLRLRVGSGGAKTWILRRRVGAKVINRKLGTYPATSLAAARREAEAMITAIEREGTVDAIDRTFGEVATYWIEKVAKGKNDSWRLQERQLERHVLPKWRDRRIAEIKRADVRALLDGVEGRVLPNRILAVIRTVFRFAMSRDWIESSPVDGITKPASETSRDRVLDMAEVCRVWQAAELLGYPASHYVQMLLLTAQRRTEVAAMRWADVDLEAGTWMLRAADTKADRAHLVPLSAPALAVLRSVPALGEFVFTTDGRTHFHNYGKVKDRLDTFLAAKSDPLQPWRFHDLRRTAATHMVRLGVSVEVVGRVLNHAVSGVTAKVYALHEFAPEKRSALDRWAAEVMRALAGEPASNVVKLERA